MSTRTRSRSRSPRVGSKVFSFDVECVAIGKGHETTDRSPCSVALVDGDGQVLFKTLIKPKEKVQSYLTPLTGVTRSDLEKGIALEEAIEKIKQLLPKDALIVGQSIASDLAWMKLTRGVDYADTVDIAEMFKGFNARYGTYSFHTLQHEALVLLGKRPSATAHDPAWDAQVSVELYKKATKASPRELNEMRQRLIANRPEPSVVKIHNYNMDGVCMAKFMRKFCTCGKP